MDLGALVDVLAPAAPDSGTPDVSAADAAQDVSAPDEAGPVTVIVDVVAAPVV